MPAKTINPCASRDLNPGYGLGKAEFGETPRLALRNEVLEETGHHVAEVGGMVYETDFVKKKTREEAWLGCLK